MKRLSFLALSILIALVLAGCGGKPKTDDKGVNADGKTVLEFWHYFAGDHERTLKAIVADFEKENPTITVKPLYQGRPQELLQKLQNSFATSPAKNPALATVYESWTSDFYAAKLMDLVEDHINGPDGWKPGEIDDIVKVYREANSYDGKLVTMPFNKSVYALYMNLDRLAAAGITTAPKNLDEFHDVIVKLTNVDGPGQKTYGIGVQPASEAFTTLYFASGGDFLNAEGKPVFDTEDARTVLNFWRNLQTPKKHLYVNAEYMDAPLANEQIAMFIYSSASFPYVSKKVEGKFKWGVAPIPGIAGRSPRYVMQGTNVGIFNNKSEGERAAAWKFLKFLTNTHNSVKWETSTGYMPIRYSVLSDPEMVKYMAENSNYAEAASWVANDLGKQEPKIRAWDGIRQEIGVMVDRVLNRNADPAVELKELEARVDKRLEVVPERGAGANKVEPKAATQGDTAPTSAPAGN